MKTNIDVAFDIISNNAISVSHRKGILRLLIENESVFKEYFVEKEVVVPNDTVWQDFVAEGKLINAIKEYRVLYNVGLKEAKDDVEYYRNYRRKRIV